MNLFNNPLVFPYDMGVSGDVPEIARFKNQRKKCAKTDPSPTAPVPPIAPKKCAKTDPSPTAPENDTKKCTSLNGS